MVDLEVVGGCLRSSRLPSLYPREISRAHTHLAFAFTTLYADDSHTAGLISFGLLQLEEGETASWKRLAIDIPD
jgi:hypothetical protein